MKTSTTVTLMETTYGGESPLRVDREAGIIYGVKALGNESQNGGTYSLKAKQDVARLLESTKVNLDHPDRKQPNQTRTMPEWIGVPKGAKATADGVFVEELHVIKSHPFASVLFECAERFANQFGLSINADGQRTKPDRQGRFLVEGVSSVRSLDIVGRPATTAGLFESVDETGETARTMKTTVVSLVESVKATLKRYKNAPVHLVEMDGGDMAIVGAPVEVPAPPGGEISADADGDGQIDEAFKMMVVAVMDDESKDAVAKVARIKEIIMAQDKLMNGTPKETPEPGATAENDKGGDKAKLEEQVQAERVTHATELLEAAGIKSDPAKAKALAAMTDSKDRVALIESWKPVPAAPAKIQKPGSSPPITPEQNVTLVESKWDAALAKQRK